MRLQPTSLPVRFYYSFRLPLLLFFAVMFVGAAGFWIVSDYKATLLDAIYMTFITVATIGFGETVDLSHSPGGRVFLMFVATVGIVNVAYATSKLTAFIVEGDLNEVLRRRRMQDRIDKMEGHYIVCGIGRVGTNVAHELEMTDRPYVAIEDSQDAIETFREKYPKALALHGDSSDDELLQRAGITRAAGLFAVTGDDSKNLLITLSAKQLNTAARVVARCHEVRNMDKIKRVGADAIVSPDFTGGMRIASSMVRPGVVNFLDEMLRSDNRLRVEEVRIPEGFERRALGELGANSRDYILLAARIQDEWQFNPPPEFMVGPGTTLVVMVNPEGRGVLEKLVSA